eukprot:gene9227-biopygen12199
MPRIPWCVGAWSSGARPGIQLYINCARHARPRRGTRAQQQLRTLRRALKTAATPRTSPKVHLRILKSGTYARGSRYSQRGNEIKRPGLIPQRNQADCDPITTATNHQYTMDRERHGGAALAPRSLREAGCGGAGRQRGTHLPRKYVKADGRGADCRRSKRWALGTTRPVPVFRRQMASVQIKTLFKCSVYG